MNRLDAIDRELAREHSVNGWSEVAVDAVRADLDTLDDSAWSDLVARIAARSVDWTIRLLDAACFAAHRDTRVIPLARALLGAGDLRIAQAPAETLESNDDIFVPDPSMRTQLEDIARRLAPSERPPIEALIARIR